MQPYFLPYIGYFQLIAAADLFVVYDNIKYTKKGWINRNRMLRNGRDAMFSLPLKKASDGLAVVERHLADDFMPESLLKQWQGAYAKAPYFAETFPLLQRIMAQEQRNLFHFIYASIQEVCRHLGIGTPIRVSSQIAIDHTLRAQEKLLALCGATGATTYINPIGGVELYDRDAFAQRDVALQFLRSEPIEYAQFGGSFVPALSILDVLMFNPRPLVAEWVAQRRALV